MDGFGKSQEDDSPKPTQKKITVVLQKKEGNSELTFSTVKEQEEGPGAIERDSIESRIRWEGLVAILINLLPNSKCG